MKRNSEYLNFTGGKDFYNQDGGGLSINKSQTNHIVSNAFAAANASNNAAAISNGTNAQTTTANATLNVVNYNKMTCAQLATLYNNLNNQLKQYQSSGGTPMTANELGKGLVIAAQTVGNGIHSLISQTNSSKSQIAIMATTGNGNITNQMQYLDVQVQMLALLQVMYSKKCNC